MGGMLMLALALQVATHAPKPTLDRMYALGEAGDHDGDGVQDLAIAGLLSGQPEGPLVVRIVSGSDFKLIVEHATPARRGCAMALHEAYVQLIEDLDGDGLRELASNQERGVLLDGATGRTLRDFGGDAFGCGLVDDAKWFGGPSLGLLRNVRWRCGAGDLSHARLERRNPHALDETRSIWDATDTQRVAPAPNAAGDVVRGACGDWRATLQRIDLGLDAADNVIEHVELALQQREADAVLWRRRFEFELAGKEWGGCADFRVAVPGDLDGDGFEDLSACLGEHLVRGHLVALSGATGEVLWKRGDFPESLNPNVERVADRDGDGLPDLLVSICDGTWPSAPVQILSSKTGARLAAFRP